MGGKQECPRMLSEGVAPKEGREPVREGGGRRERLSSQQRPGNQITQSAEGREREGGGGERRRWRLGEGRVRGAGKEAEPDFPFKFSLSLSLSVLFGSPPPQDLIRAHPAVSACSLLLLGGGGEGGGSEGETTQQSVHLPGQSSSRTEPTPAEHTGASSRLSGVSPAPSPPLSTPVRVFLWMLPQSRDGAFVTHTSGRTPRTSSTGRTSGSNLLCSKTALPAARRLCVCVSGCVSACSSILCLTVYCRTFMHLYIFKKKKFCIPSVPRPNQETDQCEEDQAKVQRAAVIFWRVSDPILLVLDASLVMR